jgi:alpha-N-arabinofuranosidase
MDRQNPYDGVHTPLIRLAGDAPRGIQQAGLVLGKGKTYTGRVVLAGMPGSKVTVSLVWGDGTGGRQVLPITSLGASYSKFPLKFTAGGDTKDGRIEISGTGQGSFHIGAVSLMPADNIRGFRPDTVGLLKQQRSGMWRFQEAITFPRMSGATPSAIRTSGRRAWIPSATCFSRTTSAPMSS